MAYICKRCRNYNPISEICKVTGKKAITISNSEIQSRNYKCFDERIYKIIKSNEYIDDSANYQVYGDQYTDEEIRSLIDYTKFTNIKRS